MGVMSVKRNAVYAALVASALVVAGFAGTSSAWATPVTLVDHGSYTTDTATNLNWLDLSATHGLSYNQVMANSGVNYIAEGWRYATSSELGTLFTDAGGSGTYPELATSYTTFDANSTLVTVQTLSNLLGWSFDPSYTSYVAFLADAAPGGQQALGLFSESYYPFPSPGIYQGQLRTAGGSASPDQTTYYSSFLVRSNVATTPLPASAVMFVTALGLLGAFGLRKRRGDA
jgi:hypothetical protein